MKKASVILLVIFLLFCSTVVGYIAGHRVTDKNIVISYEKVPTVETYPSDGTVKGYAADGKMDINTASVGQLLTLPEIGETLARRIVEYRDQYGEFYSVEDLLLVKGFGEKKLEALREYITVGG